MSYIVRVIYTFNPPASISHFGDYASVLSMYYVVPVFKTWISIMKSTGNLISRVPEFDNSNTMVMIYEWASEEAYLAGMKAKEDSGLSDTEALEAGVSIEYQLPV